MFKLWRRQAKLIDPSPAIRRLDQVGEFILRGDMHRAIDELWSLAHDPVSEPIRMHVYHQIAHLYKSQGRFMEAAKVLMKALEEPQARGVPWFWRDLAANLVLMGQNKKAKEILDTALHLTKRQPSPDSAYCCYVDRGIVETAKWVNLGVVYYLGGWLDEAESCLKVALAKAEEMAKQALSEQQVKVSVRARHPFESFATVLDTCHFFLAGIELMRSGRLTQSGVDLQWIIEYAKKYESSWGRQVVGPVENKARELLEQHKCKE